LRSNKGFRRRRVFGTSIEMNFKIGNRVAAKIEKTAKNKKNHYFQAVSCALRPSTVFILSSFNYSA